MNSCFYLGWKVIRSEKGHNLFIYFLNPKARVKLSVFHLASMHGCQYRTPVEMKSQSNEYKSLKTFISSCRDGLAVKSPDFFSRGLGFNSKHPHGSSQSVLTPVTGI